MNPDSITAVSHDEQPETLPEQIPAPPLDMVNLLVMQLEAALTNVPVPSYVKDTGLAFIESLRRWSVEGKA